VISSFASNLRCPDDGHLLGANDKGRVKFATCRHCDGLWFSREAIHSRFRAKLPEVTRSKRKKGPPKSGRRCPQCASKLASEDVEGVEIDVCPQCGGVWLDPGEYDAARRRSVKMRLHKEAPFLRPPSMFARAFDWLADYIAHLITEFDNLDSGRAPEPLVRLSLRRKRRDKGTR
jgi:Zn-finger nucleic acid-binding protein